MTHTRIQLIRKGMLEPSPFRLDELKAWDQGVKARRALWMTVGAVFMAVGWVGVALKVESQPRANVEASAP